MPPRSRATRHQDGASRPRQGQVIDLDPTDGLPVQRFTYQKVRINQDASAETSSANPKSVDSPEWAAQFNSANHPWPEPPLPSYYSDLSPWNKEMLRKARAGNTNRIASTWDRKNESWISGADQERKLAITKSNVNQADTAEKPRNEEGAGSPKSADDSGAEDSSNESNKSADEDEDGDETAPFKTTATKRRKLASGHHGSEDTSRYFEVRKWVPIPPTQPGYHDRSFLAPRRPGMPPLYAPEYAQKMFGRYHSSASLTNTSGYDLGEGGGLNNASGVLATGPANDTGVATPRKNMPPRRKKKKLGGPGRKPKALTNPVQTTDANGGPSPAATGIAEQGAGSDGMQGIEGTGQEAGGDPSQNLDVDNDDAGHDDGNDESGSEAEGSEEGEIDETGGVMSAAEEPTIPTTGTGSAATVAATASSNNDATMSQAPDEPQQLTNANVDESTEPAIPTPAVADEDTTVTTTPITPQPVVTVTITDTDTEMLDPTIDPQLNTAVSPATSLPEAVEEQQHTTSLPAPTDPEEKEIIEETLQAITGTGSAGSPVEKDVATAEVDDTVAVEAIPGLSDETAAGPEEEGVENDREEGQGETPVVSDTAQDPLPLPTDLVTPATATEAAQAEDKNNDNADPEETGEVNFLGALDEAIDREVSEGV